MFSVKRHIALLSLFVLLLPSAIQLAHTLENHEHTVVCTSTDDQHFHKQELDCSLLHFHFETYSFTATSNYAVIPQHFYKKEYNEQSQLESVVYSEKKSSRGPPHFTV